MPDLRKLGTIAERYKYPVIILVVGILLMLVPSRGKARTEVTEPNTAFAELLASIDGAGDTKVMISENGVVVVCRGAGNAAVRLDLIKAVRSYTGFGAEKITILKMTDR